MQDNEILSVISINTHYITPVIPLYLSFNNTYISLDIRNEIVLSASYSLGSLYPGESTSIQL